MRADRSLLCRGRQRGAAAIEFALVFALFFAVLYGTVSYSLPMLIMQSFNNAAAEAARQAVGLAMSPSDPAYPAQVEAQARSVVLEQLAWMPSAISVPEDAIQTRLDPATGVLRVTIDYPAGRLGNVIPAIPLVPAIDDLPPVTASIKLY